MSDLYVVTGGAGFIGSHIAERLLREGQRVRLVDNLSSGKRANIAHLLPNPRCEFYEMSVNNLPQLCEVCAGAVVIFHQAALPSVQVSVETPLVTHENAVTGTLNVLLAARAAGVRRVVYAASSAVYGDTGAADQREDFAPQPISPYGAAKLAGEFYCRAFTATYGLETVCLRYFNVFGPRQDPESQYAAVIPVFIRRMLAGLPPVIYGDGLQTRDFIYVENIVEGNLLAARAPGVAGQVINLAAGTRITLLELVDLLNELLGTQLAPQFAPGRAGDIRHSGADITRLKTLLGYTPQISLADGLAQTAAWFREQARQ